MNRRYIPVVVLLALAAAALHLALLDRGHHGDTGVFRDWWLATHAHPARLYTRPAGVNYPLLGAWLALAPGALGFAGSSLEFHRVEKLLLLPWTVLFGIALHRAHRALGDTSWRSTLSLLLPAGWAGSLYFGQLDGVCSALQLCAAWAGISALTTRDTPALVAGLVALQLSVLVKQLALFAYPMLFLLFVAGALASNTPRRALAATLLSPLLLLVPDLFVRLPPGRTLHLLYVSFDAGPPHARMIGNGPGIWSFFDWPADTPSSDAVALGLSPFVLGVALTLLYTVGLVVLLVRAYRAANDARDSAAWLVFAAGALHLAVVALLTGSHERYCLPAFPLLVLGASRIAPRLVPWVLLCASICGVYVLATIEFDAFAFFPPIRHPALAAAFVLPLLVALAHALFARYRPRSIDDQPR